MSSHPLGSVARRRPDSQLRDYIERVVDLAAGGKLVQAELPAPRAWVESLWNLAPNEASVLWSPSGEAAIAGLGTAVGATATGPDRFEQIRDRLGPLLRTAICHGWSDIPSDRAPRAYGGFSFHPVSPGVEWAAFGPARFFVPRWLLRADEDRTRLTLSLFEPRADEGERIFDEYERVLDLVDRGAAPVRAAPIDLAVRETPESAWSRSVEEIRDAIERGEVDKVVLARRTDLESDAELDPVAVLRGLLSTSEHATRFGFRFDGSTFLGSTPERLVEKCGARVRTEAVAGSRSPTDSAAPPLVESAKDLKEHAFVSHFVEATLRRLCDAVDAPQAPQLRRLPHVEHLVTPFSARVRPEVHVLDLAEQLHPTPAVGGTPSDEALALIKHLEDYDRGWYAGAIGWFDGRGDGELRVALRSGLLRGRSASIYAGAGIVWDSVPAAEYRETELKQRALLSVLGVGA